MNNSLTKAIKEAYASVPVNSVAIDSIELIHPKLPASIRLVNQRQGMNLTLENGQTHFFDAVGFKFVLPAAGENGRQDLQITIDNVDKRISAFINQAKEFFEPVEIIYRPYLSTDLTTPQMNPPLVLTLQDVSITQFQVQAKATFADILNQKFPKEYYTRKRFPSLGF